MTAQMEGMLEAVAVTRSFLPAIQFGMAAETAVAEVLLEAIRVGMDLIPDMALLAPPAAS